MSIIYSNKITTFISHEEYLNKILNESNENINYKINPKLFAINSPYLRGNQLEKNSNESKTTKRKRRSKISDTSEYPEMDQIINVVKSNFEQFLKDTKEINLFNSNVIIDNNKSSTQFVQNFYTKSEILNSMNGGNSSNILIVPKIENDEYVIPENCQFYNNDIKKIETFFNMNTIYDLIILDPPWWNKYIRRLKAADKSCSYSMLENSDILAIPIEKLINKNSLIVIWCTNSRSHIEAMKKQFLPKWQLKCVTIWYWMKVTKMGIPICEFHKPPSKQPFEQIFIACHQERDLTELSDMKILQLLISVPSAIHSHKPPLIEILSPFLPKSPKCLEIFARNLLPNFTSIGLEVLKLQNKKLYVEINKEQEEKEN